MGLTRAEKCSWAYDFMVMELGHPGLGLKCLSVKSSSNTESKRLNSLENGISTLELQFRPKFPSNAFEASADPKINQ